MFIFNAQIFGENVKRLRLQNSLTQADVAKHLDVTPTQISDIEKGKSTPSLKRAVSIAILFNTSVDELVGLTIETDSMINYPLLNKIKSLPNGLQERAIGYIDGLINN